MNLLGLRSAVWGNRLTLDKVNRALRRQVRNSDFELKIFQTHDEARAVTFLQRNRNKSSGLLLSPESWMENGFLICDTIELLNIPTVLAGWRESQGKVLSRYRIFISEDLLESYSQALTRLMTQLQSQ